MSAKDTLHDVGITGITTFGTGIAFDILSRPVQALVRKFRGTVGISGCSEAAEGAGKSAGGTSDSPYIPDDEDIALEKMYDEQGKPCEEYEDYLGEIRKHIDEPAPKVTIKGGTTSGKPNPVHHFASNKSSKYTSQFENIAKKYNLDLDDAWNKELMPHQGRHPYAYHDYVLDNKKKVDKKAQGDSSKFLKLYDQMKQKIIHKLQ